MSSFPSAQNTTGAQGEEPPRQARPTALERAFEIAGSGECHSVQELRQQLKAEGHVDSQITGPSLLRQLRQLMTPKPD